MKTYVIYKRVSTDKQGLVGLGMEAQETQILNFLQTRPSTVLASFAEVETGTNKRKRPEFQKALSLCKSRNAILVVTTLSRLSRNVHFISGLVESNVNFIALDMPNCDKTMLYIMATMCEWEADMISKRTKAALQALKAQGVKLGNPQHLTKEAQLKGLTTMNATKTEKANQFAAQLAPTLLQLKLKNFNLNKIADYLNENSIPSPKGLVGTWRAVQVQRCFAKIKSI